MASNNFNVFDLKMELANSVMETAIINLQNIKLEQLFADYKHDITYRATDTYDVSFFTNNIKVNIVLLVDFEYIWETQSYEFTPAIHINYYSGLRQNWNGYYIRPGNLELEATTYSRQPDEIAEIEAKLFSKLFGIDDFVRELPYDMHVSRPNRVNSEYCFIQDL